MDQPNTPPNTPPNAQPPDAPANPNPATAYAGDDDALGPVVTMPSKALKALKEKERAKALSRAAQQHGFGSVDEMTAYLANRGGAAQDEAPDAEGADALVDDGDDAYYVDDGAPDPDYDPAGDPAEDPGVELHLDTDQTDAEAELRDLLHRREKALAKARQLARANAREAARAKQEVAATRAEMQLRDAARGAGVRDTDYALHLLKNHVRGLPKEKRAAVDADAFFNGLRDTHPAIFGGYGTVLANSTPRGERAPAAAPAGSSTGSSGRFDARTAPISEVKKRLAELGLGVR